MPVIHPTCLFQSSSGTDEPGDGGINKASVLTETVWFDQEVAI